MFLLHSLLPQWPGNSVCRRLGDLISGVFFTNYTHPPAGTCFHTVRSLFISASLCSANCGASFTPRSNLKLYHVLREVRLIVWLASFHINMWMLTEHQSHTSSWRRRGVQKRWGRAFGGEEELELSKADNVSVKQSCDVSQKLFHPPGLYLKVCHRANSVIMGGSLSHPPPSSGCPLLSFLVAVEFWFPHRGASSLRLSVPLLLSLPAGSTSASEGPTPHPTGRWRAASISDLD